MKIKRELLEATNSKCEAKGMELKEDRHRRRSWNESAIDVES